MDTPVGAGVIDTQRVPVSYALAAAAGFFVLLAGKNFLDRDLITGGLCMIAMVVALAYAQAIYRARPRPMSDTVLTAIAVCVLTVTIDRRGLVGVLWTPPLMLMLHLVANKWASAVFDAAAVLIAVVMTHYQFDGVTAFRVGAILCISSAFAHIYARIMASHQARQEEQRQHLDLMVRCANVGGLEWDAQSRTMQPSARLLDMLGNPPQAQQPGWDVLEWVHPDDRQRMVDDFFSLVHSRAQPGEVRQTQAHSFRLVTVQGQTLWVHAEAIAVGSADGSTQKFIATFLDVTQLRAAQADTLAALHRQKELNDLRARFVAMASHEFRTPLATILSSAQLIKQYQDRLAAQDREELLQSVETGVQRMTAMLDRILLINKADAQMLEFEPERLDVIALCHAILDEVEQQSGNPQPVVDRQFNLADPMADYDPKLLRHILGNLLSNAIKYSAGHGQVVFKVYQEAGNTVFEVKDQGIGIPASDLLELFEPFHRGSNVADIKGTGLGLTIVKKSVEMHGGDIAVQSEVGHGTCFRVTLASTPSSTV